MADNLAPLLSRISGTLSAIQAACDRIERNQSDPDEIRQALNDIAAGYVMIVQLAEVAGVQRTQLLEIAEWTRERMSADELRDQIADLLFATKQLASAGQGWRDDMVQMRADIRRLATQCEALLAREAWDGIERRNGG